MCQARSLSSKVIFEGMLGAPAVFSAALCLYRYSFVCTQLETSWWYFSPLLLVQIQSGSVIFAQRHFRSHDVARVFPKTSYRNELNQCRWPHCAQFAKTKKMICILTLFDHHLTLSSRVLRPYSDLKVSVSTNTCFNGSRRKKHNGVRITVPTFLAQKLFIKYVGTWDRWSDLRWQQLI